MANYTPDELWSIAAAVGPEDLRDLHEAAPSADLAATLALAFYLYRRDGAVTTAELSSLGWSRATVRRRVARLRELGMSVLSSQSGYALGTVSIEVLSLMATWFYLERQRLGGRRPLSET